MTTEAPADDAANTGSAGEFGSSEYGDRLVYKDEGCCKGWNDQFWAIFYYVHITLMVVLAIILPITNSSSSASSTTTTNGTTLAPVSDDVKKAANELLVCIVVVLLIQCVVGALFGLIWLKVMQKFAEFIIKGMLFMVLLLCAVVAVLGFIVDSMALVVIGIVFLLINALYTWCIWSRIPFSSALLSIASAITTTFEGTICLALIMIPMNVIWYFVWAFVAYGFVESDAAQSSLSNLFWFLLLISYYWGIQVNKNVSHTTTCGVSATWYFSKEVHKPTMPALKRTLTTSFGSVCFGSFIVAVLQALRAILRSQRNGIIGCIARCILYCIERLIRYFNMYAFAQCAIYGVNFITAAKATWSLFLAKGFEAIINDDLTGLALFCGGFLALVICFFVGWFLVPAFLTKDLWGAGIILIQILIGVFGGFYGYYLCVTILQVVRSSIVCLFVCFAEDPAALSENRPDEYARLIGAKEELNTFAQNGHTGVGDGAPQTEQGQQQAQQ